MKKSTAITLALLAAATTGLLVSGCASTRIKQLSGEEFVEQARQIEVISSFQCTSYVGSSPQRAYLETGHPAWLGSRWRTTVYWTRLPELPQEIADQLRAGEPPWTPWQTRTNKQDVLIEQLIPK